MIEDIDLIRIKRGTGKVCRCLGFTLTVDPDCRKVYCNECGAEVDPFDAMLRFAQRGKRYMDSRQQLIEEIDELMQKRRRTTLFRNMERSYMTPNGGKKLYPICPYCRNTFRFEDVVGWSIRTPTDKEETP